MPALVGGIPILLKLASTLTVLFLVAGFYLGLSSAVKDDEMAGALAAVGGLVALGGFVVTQWVRFQRQSLVHQKILSDNVYYRNVNNNAGIFDYIIGEAEEQECKEAFLAYYFLLAQGAPTEDALDRRVEEWLKKTFGTDIDFECDDALAKLDRLALLRRDGDRLSVMPLDEALVQLDRIWDNFFRSTTSGKTYRPDNAREANPAPGLPTPSPFMNRLRISAGSRGVWIGPGFSAGDDADGLVLTGGADRTEVVVRRDAVEQRRQHIVRNIGHQPDVVVFQDFQEGVRLGHSPQFPRKKRHLSITWNARQYQERAKDPTRRRGNGEGA